MKKNITKTCIIDEDTIEIRLEDTSDGYINKNYLGELGNIYISIEGITIYPKLDPEEKIYALKEKNLIEAFKEIFQEKEYDPLSDKYYKKINKMIEDGTLKSLGYEIIKIEQVLEEPLEYYNKKTNRNR